MIRSCLLTWPYPSLGTSIFRDRSVLFDCRVSDFFHPRTSPSKRFFTLLFLVPSFNQPFSLIPLVPRFPPSPELSPSQPLLVLPKAFVFSFPPPLSNFFCSLTVPDGFYSDPFEDLVLLSVSLPFAPILFPLGSFPTLALSPFYLRTCNLTEFHCFPHRTL